MGMGRTLLLGLIAGATIVLGMPVGRMRRPAPGLRAMLNALAVGVLLFLVWDVLSAAWEPIDAALTSTHDGNGGLGTALGYGTLFAAGLAVGLLGLVGYEAWLARTASTPPAAARTTFGPGAMAVAELHARPTGIAAWSPARRLALLIAVGIGLHNFAEGLAIGQSAASGEIGLATLLVIGFALHNATEGFGIVAPLAAERAAQRAAQEAATSSSTSPAKASQTAPDSTGATAGETAAENAPAGTLDTRPSWGFLLALAAIGGGPTFVGTAVGHSFTSEPVAVAFLTLAAGSILYVVTQLLGLAARSPRKTLVATGLLLGLLAGFATDAIVTAAGV